MSLKRTIVIVDQETSTRKTITDIEGIELLSDLKDLIRDNGFSTAGKEIIEAISGSKFMNDNSQLPRDLVWKGEKTDNLVIMLTPLKKTASGALDRKGAYILIKEEGLEEYIKNKTGKNYTNLPTQILVDIIFEVHDSKQRMKSVSQGLAKENTSKDVISSLAEEVKAIKLEIEEIKKHLANNMPSRDPLPNFIDEDEIESLIKGCNEY